jgi:hypothetical protein
MRQTLVLRDSMISPGSGLASLESRRLSTRRSSLARLQLGLERRLSMALTTATTDTTTLGSAGGWQKQLAEAQLAYIQQAPQLSQRVEMLQKMELRVEGEEKEMEIVEPLQPRVYVNPTLELSPSTTLFSASDDEEEVAEAEVLFGLGLFPVPSSPARLWSPPAVVSTTHTSHLWNGTALYDITAVPAALSVRPKKRFDILPLTLYTSRLWTKHRLRVTEHEGLWHDPKAWRPKSIIRRRSSSAKKQRVTFMEEVITGTFVAPPPRTTTSLISLTKSSRNHRPAWKT